MSGTFTKKVVTSCMKRPRPGRLPGPCARLTPPLTPPGTWPRSQPMINSCSWSASFKPVTEFWLGGKKCRGSHPGSGLMEAPGTMATGRQCSQATLVLGKDDMRVQSTYKLAEQKFGSPLSFHLLWVLVAMHMVWDVTQRKRIYPAALTPLHVVLVKARRYINDITKISCCNRLENRGCSIALHNIQLILFPLYHALGEGDCDSDSECAGDLRCGDDNCPAPTPSYYDCCITGDSDSAIEIMKERNYQWKEVPIQNESDAFICQYNL